MDEQEVLDDMFNALSHSIRRTIILLIGSHGSASYTDMKVLDLEPGTLYFHIDVLIGGNNPLVKRNRSKQYLLTETGKSAYEMLQHGEDSLYWIEREHESSLSVASILALSPVVRRIQSDPWRFWLDILLFLGGYGYLSYMVGLCPIGLFFIEGTFDLTVTILAAIFAWISTYLLVELVSVPILSKRTLSRSLFMSIPLCFVPHIAVQLVLHLLFGPYPISNWQFTLFLTAAISWSCYILTMLLARSRSVRPVRAGIVTLIVTNMNLLLLMLIT